MKTFLSDEEKFKKGETLKKYKSSNYERNFEAHAGLIFEFIEQDPANFRISYKFNEVLEEKHQKKIEEYIRDFLKTWMEKI